MRLPPASNRANAPTRAAVIAALSIVCLLGSPAVSAQAVDASLLPCQGPASPPWTTLAATSPPICHQSLLRSGFQMGVNAMDTIAVQSQSDGVTAARRGNDVIGLRDWHPLGPPPIASDGIVDLSNAKLVEQGFVGAPGELWWGRAATGSYRCCSIMNFTLKGINDQPYFMVNESESLMFAVGQETMIRRRLMVTSLDQMRQIRSGQLGPWPSGSGSLHFAQHAALAVLATGSSPVPPGSISDATLDLATSAQASGTLRFTLQIAGRTATVNMPLKRDVDEALAKASPVGVPGNPFRLRQARDAGAGQMLDCGGERDSCHVLGTQDSKHPGKDPEYRARGLFFGAEGEYLALSFDAKLQNPDNPMNYWGAFRGLVILKRSP